MITYIKIDDNNLELDGKTIPIDPRNRHYNQIMIDVADGKAEIIDQPFGFNVAAMAKQDEINSIAKQAFSLITNSYLQYEIDTFKTQEEEANAWRLDNTALTPTLDGIVANRPGITKAVLVDKILDVNAPAYKAVSGAVMGKKQHFEDLLEALKTQHEDPDQDDITQADFNTLDVDFS